MTMLEPTPRPRPGETLIPLTAAGRQPLFFFGTLMDRDVLAHVLSRPVDPDELMPASLAGFRRLGCRAGSYPVLVPGHGTLVEGLLLRRASRRDIARINHYESEEYEVELRLVATAEGHWPAWLFRALDHLEDDGIPWALASWQARHKAGFFALCDGWMRNFVEPPP